MAKSPAHEGPVRTRVGVERIEDRMIARLDSEASQRLPSRGQVAVTVEIEGRELATVVEPDGRRGHWIAVDEWAGDVAEGDEIDLVIEVADHWPEPEVPEDLRLALDQAPDIADQWQDITPMARWEWVRWVKATKNPATRAKRIGVAISKLRDGKRRPCCFDLASCTDPALAKSGKLVVAD